jgi:hypothetical protein
MASAAVWITFGFLSLHDAPGYNGLNYGLGVEYQLDRTAIVAGAYENSHNERSRYAGVNVTMAEVSGVRLGATLGAVDGYRDSKFDLCTHGGAEKCRVMADRNPDVSPLVTPTASFDGDRFGANVVLAPAMGDTGNAIALQLKKRIR